MTIMCNKILSVSLVLLFIVMRSESQISKNEMFMSTVSLFYCFWYRDRGGGRPHCDPERKVPPSCLISAAMALIPSEGWAIVQYNGYWDLILKKVNGVHVVMSRCTHTAPGGRKFVHPFPELNKNRYIQLFWK